MKIDNVAYHEDGYLYLTDSFHKSKVGKRIGTVADHGYEKVTLGGKQHYTHRVVFYMHHGYLPKEIDHIDRNKLNNRIDNLRDATRKQNVNNRAPTKGYTFVKDRGKYKVTVCRQFGGYFDNESDAKAKAEQMREELYDK